MWGHFGGGVCVDRPPPFKGVRLTSRELSWVALMLRLPQIPARAGGACPGHRWPPAASSAVRFARDASGSCGCNDRAPPGFPAGLVPGRCRRRAGCGRSQSEFIGHGLRFPGRLVRRADSPARAWVLPTYRPPLPGPLRWPWPHRTKRCALPRVAIGSSGAQCLPQGWWVAGSGDGCVRALFGKVCV